MSLFVATHLLKMVIVYYSMINTSLSWTTTMICINSESHTIFTSNTSDISIEECQNHRAITTNNNINTPIICPQHQNCSIQCLTINSCQSLTINCPTNNNTNCNLNCLDIFSCDSTIINAQWSHQLIIDCNASHSCQNINIYCPKTNIYHNNINCKIRGSDESIHSNLTIYTLNGWNDIDVSQYEALINIANNNNKMYCNDGYNDSCLISTISWNCIDTQHICYGYSFDTTYIDGYDYNDLYSLSSTIESTEESGISTPMFIGGGVFIFLIIYAICCICCCTQYRRKQEDLHKIQDKKEQQKSAMYGDIILDDTLYVDDDEIVGFNVVEDSNNNNIQQTNNEHHTAGETQVALK